MNSIHVNPHSRVIREVQAAVLRAELSPSVR
jgi:hypothetical protein